MGRRAVLVLFALALLAIVTAGCGGQADDALLDQARSDLGCDRLATRYMGSRTSRRGREYWIVEGCGRAAHYECVSSLFAWDDWTCRLVDRKEMPGQTAGVVD